MANKAYAWLLLLLLLPTLLCMYGGGCFGTNIHPSFVCPEGLIRWRGASNIFGNTAAIGRRMTMMMMMRGELVDNDKRSPLPRRRGVDE